MAVVRSFKPMRSSCSLVLVLNLFVAITNRRHLFIEAQIVANGKSCTSDTDCASFACARETASAAAPLICCQSSFYAFVPAIGNVCTWQESASLCPGNRNELCLSNVCVDDMCQDDQLSPGEACDDDSDCFTHHCGRSAGIGGNEKVCCPRAIDAAIGRNQICDGGTLPVEEDEEYDIVVADEEENSSQGAGELPTPCINSTALIREREALVEDTSMLRTYTLCPGSYRIGSYDFDEKKYVDGMPGLELYNSNVHINCLEEKAGSCRLIGGRSQMAVFLKPDRDEALKNVRISHIDFAEADGFNAAFYARGDVTFKRCRFIGNNNVDGLLDIIGGKLTGELLLSVEDCTFRDNNITGSLYPQTAALVFNRGQTLQIRNATFLSNTFDSSLSDDWDTTIVDSRQEGATFVESSCFIDNNAKSAIYGGATQTQNYATGHCKCNGIMSSKGKCTEFDEEMCSTMIFEDVLAGNSAPLCPELPDTAEVDSDSRTPTTSRPKPTFGNQAVKEMNSGSTERPTGKPTDDPEQEYYDKETESSSADSIDCRRYILYASLSIFLSILL